MTNILTVIVMYVTHFTYVFGEWLNLTVAVKNIFLRFLLNCFFSFCHCIFSGAKKISEYFKVSNNIIRKTAFFPLS